MELQLRDDQEPFTSQFLLHFKPIKILGRGGFGIVFQAEKHVEERITLWNCAVKRIPMKNSGQDIDKKLREVQALLAFDHEGIVKFEDAWVEKPPPGWQRYQDGKLFNELHSNEHFTYRDDSVFLYIRMELCKSSLDVWLSNNKHRNMDRMKD